MDRVIHGQQLDMISADVGSPVIEFQLRGLQTLARQIEAGGSVAARGKLSGEIQARFFSPVTKVRRWAYYCAMKMRLREALGPLEFSVRSEQDPECRLWAWKAYIDMAPLPKVAEMLNDPDFDYHGTALEMLHTGQISTQLELWERKIQEDVVGARWAGISYGYGIPIINAGTPTQLNRELVKGLQLHEDVSVAEYAVWAFFNRSDGGQQDLLIPRDEIQRQAPGIRGWAYRLLLRQEPEEDMRAEICAAIALELSANQKDAKKGLASAIKSRYWPGLEDIIIPWFEIEEHTIVRDLLIEHIVFNATRCDSYKGYAAEIFRDGSAKDKRMTRAAIVKAFGQGEGLLGIGVFSGESGDIVMGNKFNINSVTGNVVNFGTIKDSAMTALGQIDHRHSIAPMRDEFERLLALVASEKAIEPAIKAEVAASVEEIAKSEGELTPEGMGKVVAALKKAASAAKSSAEIAGSAEKIIDYFRNIGS